MFFNQIKNLFLCGFLGVIVCLGLLLHAANTKLAVCDKAEGSYSTANSQFSAQTQQTNTAVDALKWATNAALNSGVKDGEQEQKNASADLARALTLAQSKVSTCDQAQALINAYVRQRNGVKP